MLGDDSRYPAISHKKMLCAKRYCVRFCAGNCWRYFAVCIQFASRISAPVHSSRTTLYEKLKPSRNLSTSAASCMGIPCEINDCSSPGDHCPPPPGHPCRVVTLRVYWSPRQGPSRRRPLRQGGLLWWPFPYMFFLLVPLLLQPMGVPCRSSEPACHCSNLSKFASSTGIKYAKRSTTDVLSAIGAPGSMHPGYVHHHSVQGWHGQSFASQQKVDLAL